ncbi:hypothetical protein B7494_g6303 [Chlorociboria aeruginascens]|nr:hypothetical protein B7494_g6303 [Chlorociboria aeruginascens]
MIQPRISRCIQGALHHSRRKHTSSQHANAPLSVSRLLETQPIDPENITINGFVRSIRNQKLRSFAAIGDGSSLRPLQALLTPQQAQGLSTGTAVRLSGSWKPSLNPKAQSHELHVEAVDILGEANAATFPLQKKYHTPEYLRTIPHLRSRTPFNSTLLRFRSQCISQLTQFFADQDFIQSHPPIITSSDCEGAGEVFEVASGHKGPATNEDDGTFFRSPKYLTVSSQLHLEALAQSVGKVWTLSPTFRAEKSDTPRHLSEFYMLEAEMNFAKNLDHVMSFVEKMLENLTRNLHKSAVGQEILSHKGDEDNTSREPIQLERRWECMMSGHWERITYSEAINYLQMRGPKFNHEPTWGLGLQAEHERFIAAEVGGGSPVFVTDYPKAIKPFYMSPSESPDMDHETVSCFDLLVPETCEIVGGSMREYRLPELINSMRARGMIPPGSEMPLDEELGSLKWYVDLRRWGSMLGLNEITWLYALLLVLSSIPTIFAAANNLTQIFDFGSNPTNISMYIYIPSTLQPRPPIFVNPHWCHGSAEAAFQGTQFATLADIYGYIIIYPNSSHTVDSCWDVSSHETLTHDGGGDSLGIANMVHYALHTYNGNEKRVFSMGTSSGAMMTNVLLGSYPDLFAAGSAWAGVAFGCFAGDGYDVWNSECAAGDIIKTGPQWKAIVEAAYPGYRGWRPKMQVFHGTADTTLYPQNLKEEIKEWTAVLGLPEVPKRTVVDSPLMGWTTYDYGETFHATSAANVTHNIPTVEDVVLDWFGLKCAGVGCFERGTV